MNDEREFAGEALSGLRAALGMADDGAEARALLKNLASRPVLLCLLRGIIEDEELLSQIAGNSFHHVLGFDKIVLMSAQPAGRLRLHVWRPSEFGQIEHPHNHRYASHSALIVGKLRTHIYRKTDAGMSVTEYREQSDPAENRWGFVEVGTTFLTATMRRDLSAGDMYSMSEDTVHHIEAPRKLTATLFLEMRRSRDWSEVFIRTGDQLPVPVTQQHFTPSELRIRLLRIVKFLVSRE